MLYEHQIPLIIKMLIKPPLLSLSISLPKKLSPHRSHLEDPTGQRLSLHQWWREHQLLLLDQFARDPCWHGSLAGRDDQAHARVTAAAHGATSRIDEEGNQETVNRRRENKMCVINVLRLARK